jgi:hypothetical protein
MHVKAFVFILHGGVRVKAVRWVVDVITDYFLKRRRNFGSKSI